MWQSGLEIHMIEEIYSSDVEVDPSTVFGRVYGLTRWKLG